MASSTKTSEFEANSIERFGNYTWGFVRFFFHATIFIFTGVIFSILIEWGGMMTIWSDQGETHSTEMLKTEIGYLEKDFARQIMGVSPRRIADQTVINTKDFLRADTGWRRYVMDLRRPTYATDNTAIEYAKAFMRNTTPYLSAAHNIIVLYVVRMMIVFLSLPLIVLVAFAWLIDGFCQRELRKDGGGRESTTKFHFFSKYIAITLLAPFIVYLASPVATHPNWVLAPIAITIGCLTFYASSNYKKYV